MRALHLPVLLLTSACGIVAGCATQPGVTTGSVQSGYILSAAEMHWHCGGLENAVNARITTIVALSQQAKDNANSTAPTVSAMLGRVLGEQGDDEIQSQIKAERSAADAYNASLASKGCSKVDIDGKLAALGVGRAV